jgi:hypothetical protein
LGDERCFCRELKQGAHPRLTSRGVGHAEDALGLADHLVGEAPFVVDQAMTLTSVAATTLDGSRSTMAARGSPTMSAETSGSLRDAEDAARHR